MTIAVCDEDKKSLDYISELLVKKLDQMAADAEVFQFDSGEKLLAALSGEMFDLIFLDMSMEGISGPELGKIIRQRKVSSYLVYISSDAELIESIFETDPAAFLRKPIDSALFEKTLKRICNKMSEETYFEFHMNYKTTKVKTREIMHFESSGRKVRIILSTGEVLEFYGKLDDVERYIREELRCRFFIRIHKSFLVNENYICKIEKNMLTLKDGKMLSISRIYQRSIKTFRDFLCNT